MASMNEGQRRYQESHGQGASGRFGEGCWGERGVNDSSSSESTRLGFVLLSLLLCTIESLL